MYGLIVDHLGDRKWLQYASNLRRKAGLKSFLSTFGTNRPQSTKN